MIVKMKKLNVVGLISEKKMILDVLRSSGCFELSGLSEAGSLLSPPNSDSDSSKSEELHHRLHILDMAIDTTTKLTSNLKDELKENARLTKKGEVERTALRMPPLKKPLFFYRQQVSSDRMNEIGLKGEQITAHAQKINAQRERIDAIDIELASIKKELSELQVYENVDVKFGDISDSKHFFMLLGVVSRKNALKAQRELSDIHAAEIKIFDAKNKRSIFFITAPSEYKEQATSVLAGCEFSSCQFDYNQTAIEAISALKKKSNEIYNEKLQILYDIANDTEGLDQLKVYYDYIELELESIEAQANIGTTKKTYCIEGWVPAKNADEIVKMVESASSCVECQVLEPHSSTQPPTLTRSNALVSPYESVTNMYSPPSPLERDPNPFVAIFFFIFFGIMIGDAIYGIVLFALTFVLMRCYKMETNFKKLMMILCMGGISAFIWGAVYNSWAAVGLPYNPILNPVENPFDFLMITLGFGYVQIMFGFLLKLIANIRAKDALSALADSGWKLSIMIGAALNLPSVLTMFERQFTIIKLPTLPSPLLYVGLIMIAVGLVGMLLTGGRHKRTVGGKIISGVGSWYDLVGLLSDILSYCRLFGLALSGAIIGMVANILASDVLFQIPVVGYILGIAVAVFFHIFNLALACLGAYVHNSRLQFVEFFGKFYEGGGRAFKPMGHCTKYTSIK